MSSSNPTFDAVDNTRKPSPAGFVALIVLAIGLGAFALYKGEAPIKSIDPYNWVLWARGIPTWAGVLAIGLVVFLIGLIGTFRALFSAPKPARKKNRRGTHGAEALATIEMEAAPAIDIQTATRASESRGNLRFNAQNIATLGIATAPQAVAVEPPSIEVESLEPAIFSDHAAFSDNASDSFMTRNPEAPIEATAEVPAFDAAAALTDTHGLHITTHTAQIVPIRADIELPAGTAYDPLAAALLAETPEVVTDAPQGDINAVISSAMRFAPQSELQAEPLHEIVSAPQAPAPIAPEILSPEIVSDVVPAPVAVAAPIIDDETEIRQATQTALSVWPDATRAIAADELSTRISHLYYDKSPQAQKAFHMIASGNLSTAASALASHADTLALAGNYIAAAELWRVSGALHMGRDDGKAMTAYEHVSELDPNDANIHLYLARRYQMAGDTAKQPAVIGRALGVISDPATRAELLAPYADLKLKAGDPKSAGDALEELARLNETTAYLKPDDVSARSALAITLARLAQAREMHGAFDLAGPLYKKAHQVFADLSAMKPEHPGLRAMADNAFKDAQRFNMA